MDLDRINDLILKINLSEGLEFRDFYNFILYQLENVQAKDLRAFIK